MKKILLAFAIGTASLLSFSSCTKEYVTNYLPGYSYVFPLSSGDWVKTADNTYEAVISMPELDDVYYEDGHVNVAIQFENNVGTYYNVPAENPGDRGHSYNAYYSVGKVYLKAFDLFTENVKPEAMRVKIVLTDAEIGN